MDSKSDIAFKHVVELNLPNIRTTTQNFENDDEFLSDEYFEDLSHENINKIKEHYKKYFDNPKFKLDRLQI